MTQIKRQLNFDQFFEVKTKKLRSSTSLEDLPNEIFYEIFDYLDGCDIHKAFSNLNIRFENLLINSLLPLKINLSSQSQLTLEHCCRHVIIPNKHRIISLHLSDDSLINSFFDHCYVDSSFNRLESVVLSEISQDNILIILFYLNSLPRLSSLTIQLEEDYYYNLTEIYRLIFRFPCLKYYKLSVSDYEESDIIIPMSINAKPSTIERLVINFDCALNELTSLLSHTPYLQHLTCEQVVETDKNNRNRERLTLPHLTHISIASCNIEFDEFEVFIKKISSQLRMLRLTVFWNPKYLDANRWKQLIKKHMPHLREFHFDHHIFDDDDTPDYELINQFTSSFWNKREWVFELENRHHEVIYSIHPYREKWFNCHIDNQIISNSNRNTNVNTPENLTIPRQQKPNNCLTQFIPPIQLTLDSFILVRQIHSFIEKMKPCFLAVQFTHLNIDCHTVPIAILIEIIRLLPDLDSLEVSSLPVVLLNGLSFEDSGTLLLVSITNKITKVKLDKMDGMEQVHFLMDLCSHMQYLEVECTTQTDLENIVRSIAINSITYILYLKCLCLCVPNANEKMIENLNIMIDFERCFHVDKKFRDYVVRRRQNKIFLNWELQ